MTRTVTIEVDESLASLLLGAAILVAIFVLAFVIVPVLA